MGWRLDKTKAEIEDFVAEVIRDNGPRYSQPSEWPHLYVDVWVSLFSMSYTMGHVVAFGLPVLVLLAWWL